MRRPSADYGPPAFLFRRWIGSRTAPVILTSSCARCHGAAKLSFMDQDRIGSDAAKGARWDCPYCQTRNWLPAIGTVTSIVPV